MKLFRNLMVIVLLASITIALVICCIQLIGTSQMAQKIIGKWKYDFTSPEGDISAHCLIFLQKGWVFTSTAHVVHGDRYIDVDSSGWWHMKNGAFGMMVTNSSNTNVIKIGKIWSDKISKVDDHYFVFQSTNGKTLSWERVQ